MTIKKTIQLSPNANENTEQDRSTSVSLREFKVLRKKTDGAVASLLVLGGEIELKVSKDDIVNSINLSTEGITIDANRINLTGYVTVTALGTAGQTVINGGNITTGTLSADRIFGGTINGNNVSVINLNASNINAGTLTGRAISGGSINIGSGNFVVSSGGAITARSGVLGNASYSTFAGNGIQFSGPVYITGLLTLGSAGLESTGNLIPTEDAFGSVGQSGRRWLEFWAQDGTINTSDMSDKKDIQSIDKAVAFIRALPPVQYKWKNGKRNHHGFLAQDVKNVLDSLDMDFGFYVDPEVGGEEGHKGLRYTELIAPIVHTIQDLYRKIEELENGKAKI